MNNGLQARPTGLKLFNVTITNERTQEYLKQVLGEKRASFVNNVTALVGNNKLLQNCEPMSVVYASIQATANNLPLGNNLGFAYVIPYGKDAQFQMGYKGFIQLAMRSNQIRTINVRDVREGELKGEDFVTGEIEFEMLPYAEREKAKVIGYMAFFETTYGFRKMDYWSVEKVQEHAKKFSKTYSAKGGVWQLHFDAMAKKTVLKQLIQKYAPMSIELQEAINSDQRVYNAEGDSDYADNPVDSFEAEEAEVVESRANEQGKTEVPAETLAAAQNAAEDKNNDAAPAQQGFFGNN